MAVVAAVSNAVTHAVVAVAVAVIVIVAIKLTSSFNILNKEGGGSIIFHFPLFTTTLDSSL
ncbi:hypothetical protein KDA_19990 [Dictyobacter alpinus]|uniref:Uncharacterized protein n=1 Tax=Dictyobacter alpinus TaxID=2014873 RepID=A0A402B5A6_9CHLR|nr:hypothetical protein KDA_19990 [Dictyobacter alpinus]